MKKIMDNWEYVKNYKLNSLFWRLSLTISVLLVVPFITLGILFYTNTRDTIQEEMTLENTAALHSERDIINNTLNECDLLSSYLATNDNTEAYILTGSSNSIHSTSTLVNTLPLIYKYIDSIYIYSDTDDTVLSGKMTTKTAEFADSGWMDDYKSIASPRGTIIFRQKNNIYPSLITILKPIYIADEKRGAIVMNIDSSIFYNSVTSAKYTKGQSIYVVSPDGRIILSKDYQYFNEPVSRLDFLPDNIMSGSTQELNIIKDGLNIIVSRSDDYFDYTYISTYPTDLYKSRFDRMKLHIIIISFILLLICSIIAYIISVKSYDPVQQIISFLDKTAPDENLSTESKNELIYIINSIQAHIENKAKMEKILEERMSMLKKSQYAMLQAQINPHFLYNTLETINWMAYSIAGSDNPVSEAVINLAGFLRHTLTTSSYLITIENEIKYTEEYLHILKLRYDDLFDIEWDIDSAILPMSINKICLQPIIENAVYHGLKPKGNKGILKISGSASNGKITITVNDNGVGIEPKKLQQINDDLKAETIAESSHIGMSNVNTRIKIIFGSEYGLTVDSAIDQGTTVYITIPQQKLS